MAVAPLALAFLAGAWLALVVRALIAESSRRRIANAAASGDPLSHLREYIAVAERAERQRVVTSLSSERSQRR